MSSGRVIYTGSMATSSPGGIHAGTDDPKVLEVAKALTVDLDWLRRQPGQRAALEVALHAAWIDHVCRDTEANAGVSGQLSGTLTLHSDETLLLQAALTGGIQVPCARCLEPADVDATSPLCLTFVPARRLAATYDHRGHEDPEGLELSAGDLDEIAYQGAEVDLQVTIREHLLLAYPMRALCALDEACRGLCGHCGALKNAMPADSTHCSACKAPFDGFPPEAGGNDEIPEWKRKLMEIAGDD